MKLTVFFSWQSDIDNDKLNNKSFLCDCINTALKNLENKGELKNVFFEFQESTSNISGNPSIPNTLDKRIENCDILIADLSIVDSYSKLELFLRKLRKAKTKRGPNNNVFGEYNKALASHSDEQIITIMNCLNGDPKDDNSIIPFDVRERRFPIGYLLKTNKDAEKVRSSVISQLEISIKASALSAIQNAQSKYHPFITYNEQQKWIRELGGFIQTNELCAFQKQIRDNKENIRLVGLSGLGKTRIVFEAFKNSQENVNYLYCDCYTNEESSIIGAANKIYEEFKEAIIIIDNCPRVLLEKLIFNKKNHQASNPIIAIYHDVNETNIIDTNQIILPKKQIEVVEGIIDRYKSYYKPEQRERLIEFSGGIPLIAIRLCKSLKEGNPIGVFNDETLLSKLLGTDENTTERKMLRSLSLFNFIGAFEDARNELLFVASNKDITPIDGSIEVVMNDFDNLIGKSIEREIMERNGRFIAIRPKPIGLQLTSEWISECNSDRLLRVVKAIQESDCADSLTESFSKHFKYMQHDEKAVSILNTLLQTNSPFHNAEVINTELGSRLFRSFVEVNPVAVANCLWSVFGDMKTEQLKKIDDGRRNIIWTLEKLCFDVRTYEKGMKLMLMFGAAENETWGNNATNEFIRLFKIYLPGTQASLSERLTILKWGMAHDSYKEVTIKALQTALETLHFTYMCGAEYQGTKQLEHYQPKTKEEISVYWNECLNLISSEILKESPYTNLCEEVLEQSVMGVCSSGASHIILPIIKVICEKKKYDWEEMLDSLWWIKIHAHLNPDMLSDVSGMIDALTKTDFVSRFKEVGNRNRKIGDNLKYAERIAKQKESYQQLANEFAKTEINKTDTLMQLYQIDNNYTHPFGYTIAKLFDGDSDKTHWFINTSIECFHSLNNYYPSLFFDFTRGISEDAYDYLVSTLMTDNKCSFLLFPIMANHGVALSQTQLLFELVENKKVSVEHFLYFWRCSIVISSSSEKEIINFFSKVIKCNDKGFNIVISMLNNMLFFNKEKECSHILEFITSEFLQRSIIPTDFMHNDDYFEVINHILSHDDKADLAKYVNRIMIEVSKNPNYHLSCDYRVEQLYNTLLNDYFPDIAFDLLSAITSNKSYTSLAFQFLLAPKEYGVLSHTLFQEKNIELILNFCEQEPVAQERIMRIVPAIQEGQFSPLVMCLLDKYGDNEDMLSSLSANIGSFSFVGSLIPLYESRINTLSTLLSHSNPTVASWASAEVQRFKMRIDSETKKEAEDKFFNG